MIVFVLDGELFRRSILKPTLSLIDNAYLVHGRTLISQMSFVVLCHACSGNQLVKHILVQLESDIFLEK